MSVCISNAPPHNLFKPKASISRYNSFRKVPSGFRQISKLFDIKPVNENKCQLTLRPVQPLRRKRSRNVNKPLTFQGNERPNEKRVSLRNQPNTMMQARRPLVQKVLRKARRNVGKISNAFQHPRKVRCVTDRRTPLKRINRNSALKKHSTVVQQENYFDFSIVVQASNPKTASFLPQKVHAAVASSIQNSKSAPKKRAWQLCVSEPKSVSVLEDVFFLDREEETREIESCYWCPNAPDSEDEMESEDMYGYEPTTDFADGEDEIIVEQPDGCPLRKKCRYLGVSWNTQHGKWIAQVGHQGKRHYVGQFHDCRVAAIAIDEFCLEMGIHPRNKTILSAMSTPKKCCPKPRKTLNPNWQTRGERSMKRTNKGVNIERSWYY